MNKLNNKKLNIVFYSFQILTILVLGVTVSPLVTDARIVTGGSSVTPYNSTKWNNNVPTVNQYNPGYYFYEEPNVSNGYTPPVVNNSNNSSTSNKTTTVNKNTSYSDTSVEEENTEDESNKTVRTSEDVSNLASSVILGSDSFLPSGLLQWILFAILIVLIVIIVRRIMRGEERYHAAPLKHA